MDDKAVMIGQKLGENGHGEMGVAEHNACSSPKVASLPVASFFSLSAPSISCHSLFDLRTWVCVMMHGPLPTHKRG